MNYPPLIIDRLKSEVPALHERVEGVVDLAGLIARRQLPPQTPAAWVLSLGDDGAAPVEMTGAMRQLITEQIGVVLIHRIAGDAKGAKAQAELDTLLIAVRDALAGWEPDQAADPVEYRRARLLSMTEGVVFVQIDFLARWYLRVTYP